MNDADFVVETFDEAKRDFIFRLAVRCDAVPMTVDHFGEFFVRLETLPEKLRFPVVEKLSRPRSDVYIQS